MNKSLLKAKRTLGNPDISEIMKAKRKKSSRRLLNQPTEKAKAMNKNLLKAKRKRGNLIRCPKS